MGLLDHCAFVRALHQLVYLGTHRTLDDLQQSLGAHLGLDRLGAPYIESAETSLVVGRDRYRLEDPLDLVVGEAFADEALTRGLGDKLLRTRTGRHSLRSDTNQAAHTTLRRDRGPDQRVQLLRLLARDRRRLVLGVARLDRHLGARAVLTLAHALCDVRGERLGLERLTDHNFVDRLVDRLLKTRHVYARLARVEVDVTLDVGVIELLAAVDRDANDLLDAGHANAREADRRFRHSCLNV